MLAVQPQGVVQVLAAFRVLDPFATLGAQPDGKVVPEIGAGSIVIGGENDVGAFLVKERLSLPQKPVFLAGIVLQRLAWRTAGHGYDSGIARLDGGDSVELALGDNQR